MRQHIETYERIGDVQAWVARPRAALAGRGGPRARLRAPADFDPHVSGADDRPAPGGLGVLDDARASGCAGSRG